MLSSPSRYLLYSHDTYGLGHLRRTALVAEAIVARSPEAQVLIATGSPRAQSFPLPTRVDTLKLPSVTKDADGAYLPRKFSSGLGDLVRLRSNVLLAAFDGFRPDVILVDQSPTGMAGELIPVLTHAGESLQRPRIVLGLRDVIDAASRVDADWTAGGIWEWLDRYDDVFVYGDERLVTTATELRLRERVGAPVVHVGFVAPRITRRGPVAGPTGSYLLVTPGGGGDGQTMLRRFLDAADAGATDGLRTVIVTGPLMSWERRAEIVQRANTLPHVEVVEFVDDMRSLISSAVGVISMAGYNTVTEVLAAGRPAMLVPRTAPRLEQDIRARRLSAHTALERCPVDDMTPQRVIDFVQRLHAGRLSNHLSPPLDLGGASRAASILTAPQRRRHRRAAITRRELTHV